MIFAIFCLILLNYNSFLNGPVKVSAELSSNGRSSPRTLNQSMNALNVVDIYNAFYGIYRE